MKTIKLFLFLSIIAASQLAYSSSTENNYSKIFGVLGTISLGIGKFGGNIILGAADRIIAPVATVGFLAAGIYFGGPKLLDYGWNIIKQPNTVQEIHLLAQDTLNTTQNTNTVVQDTQQTAQKILNYAAKGSHFSKTTARGVHRVTIKLEDIGTAVNNIQDNQLTPEEVTKIVDHYTIMLASQVEKTEHNIINAIDSRATKTEKAIDISMDQKLTPVKKQLNSIEKKIDELRLLKHKKKRRKFRK